MILLCLVCLLSGCATQSPTTIDSPVAQHVSIRGGRVILFRGAYFGLFSHGLDEIARDLRDEGIDATVLPHNDWQRVAETVPASRPGHPVILVGHSFGADAAIHLSRDLR